MWALVTGASSGIGMEIARYLAEKQYDLILCARNELRLAKLKTELLQTGVDVEVIPADLSKKEECFRLYRETEEFGVDFLVNNAGFGVYGQFLKTDLAKELDLISVNVTAVHILTKLFLKDMQARGSGIILNVGSSAGFLAGPSFSSYYASKNYVVRLTEAIHEELRRSKSNVKISVLCPGPVDTRFNETADVKFALKGLNAADVAKTAVEGALAGKMVIIPGFGMKAALFFSKRLPETVMTRITYEIQSRKGG